MKFILPLFFGSFFCYPSTAQTDASKVVGSVLLQDSIKLISNAYGLGCYETIRYLKKDGTIRKEILDGKNGRRTIVTYKKDKNKIKTKYSDKWAMNSLPQCGLGIEIKD